VSKSATDHDLLFGLLALQNGLIEQDQLINAFRAWTLDRSRSLGDHLETLGILSPGKRALLEALAAVHLETHGGDIEKSLAAVPAGRAARAGLARLGEPEIEATIARIGRVRIGQAAESDSDGESDDPERTAGLAVGASTSDGRRFRMLRPHARGGLGSVFVALDAELKREVALKQILEQYADDPFRRQRFLAEAEITGGLEHPGVVPVYGLGTHAGGRPYYVMRLIRGDSLKEAVEHFHADQALKRDPGRRSLGLRKLFRRFLDVCNAIDYAHSRGVIHRDIKPANIIVGKHGETLVVDWGLAKAMGRADPCVDEQILAPSSPGSFSETLPGIALGTPAYMSPEQARGDLDCLGPRSDVYSLGATLHCLLTGKPPFEGDDMGAILRAVQAGEFPRPSQRDLSIDRALEAVCLKAMALRPEDRYPTPRALADDLERWMADEPVTAWREPFFRRARRWARRNRTAVTAATVAMLAVILGLGAVAGVQARANGELRSLNGRLTRANAELAAEKARVQERFDLAMEVIQTLHTGVSEDFLLKEVQFKGLHDRLLKSAADFYARLAAILKDRADRDSRRALGRAEFELAELTAKVGDQKGALEAHRQVLSLREALASEPGADAESDAEVGRSLVALGRRQEAIGRTAEAIASYQTAQVRLAALVEAHASVASLRADLAVAEYSLGWLLHLIGKPAEGLGWLERARDAQEALARDEPTIAQYQSDLALSHNSISRVLANTGQSPAAHESLRRALAIRQHLAEANPTVASFHYDLGMTYFYIGEFHRNTGQPAAALDSYDRAREILQRVAAANPAVTQIRSDLARSHQAIGQLLKATGELAPALESTRRALAIRQHLAETNPAVAEFQSFLALNYGMLSELEARAGQLPGALESARRGIDVARKLVASSPELTEPRVRLAYALTAEGRVNEKLGRRAEAGGSLREAIATMESIPLAARNPVDDYSLACKHALLAGVLGGDSPVVLMTRSEGDQAMEALRRAVARGYRNLSNMRSDTDLEALRPRPEFQALLMDMAFPDWPFAP